MPSIRTLFYLLCCALFITPSAQAQTVPDFELASADGLRLRIYSQLTPLQINRIHSWELELLDASGSAVDGATITVVGGMPDHDHGLPTNPQVTGTQTNGRYLLEGIRFHMQGRWLMQFNISSPQTTTNIDLEFNL